MTDQHRATPEQWVQGRPAPDPRQLADQIQSLRARVKALEATRHAYPDLSRFSDAEREQIMRTAGFAYAESSEQRLTPPMAERQPATEWIPSTALLHGGSPAPTTESRPAGLVERVAEAMQPGTFDWSAYEDEARAAIREVAVFARSKDLNGQQAFCPTWEMVAQWLEQEADRA
jgi:hypothetical protein